MRRLIFFAILSGLFPRISYCQLVTAEQLKAKRIELYGRQSWKNTAKVIASSMKADDKEGKYAKLVGNRVSNLYYDGAYNNVRIVEGISKSRNQLFEILKRWASSRFDGSDCDIRLIDKEAGRIIVQGSEGNLIKNESGWDNSYNVSLRPVLTLDVKDGRVRIIFKLSTYNIHRERITGGLFSSNIHNDEVWHMSNCYPFSENDDHSRTSSMALVLTHLCSLSYMEIVEGVIKGTISSDFQDNW